MGTTHIGARPGQIADTVLLPGDPLRARFIAEQFLTDASEVTGVRNMLGYTGFYRDMPVSVMGGGMGIPSNCIYATELAQHYGVRRLLRVGSCGAVADSAALGDLVIGLGACTDSGVNRTRFGGLDFAATADFELTRALVDAARAGGRSPAVGNLFSSDLFYNPNAESLFAMLKRYGIVGIEMEAAGLYGVAAECRIRAATLCTVSDHVLRGEEMSAGERERGFAAMIDVALEALIADQAQQREGRSA